MTCGSYAAVVERSVLEGAEPGWVLDLLNGHFGVFAHKPADDTEIDSETLCLSCFVDEHPEAGRGLDLARQHGAAEWVNGGWQADPG